MRYLVWLAQDDHEHRKMHFAALFENHFEDPAMAGLCGLLVYESDTDWTLPLIPQAASEARKAT